MTTAPDIKPLYLHPHEAANAPVRLHEGPVVLHDVKGDAQGTATLVLSWLPSTGLRLDVDVTSGRTPHPGARVRAGFANSVGDVLVSSAQVGSKEGVPFSKVAGTISSFETGSGDKLSSLGFQLVNFCDFLTPGPKPSPAFGFPPFTADLESDDWRIRLTTIEKSREIFKSLDETCGYAFTHLGRLERKSASLFTGQDAESVLSAVCSFLCFARGAACSLPVRWGVDDAGDVVWQRWGSPIVDAWKTPHSWFDEHHGNLLTEIFPAFVTAYADADLGPPLKLALHWYQKSNTRAGGMEGAIILGLTALDLLGALVVVDRTATMGAGKYDDLKAALKLAELLKVLKVPAAFPARLSNLAAFAGANAWSDACVALSDIRHGYVHSNRRRRAIVLSAPNLAIFEAWQLSLWYQELALLFFLNHRGEYRNRLTAEWLGIVESVPWL